MLWPVTHHCPHQQDLTNFFKTRTGQHLDELTDLNALDHLVVVDSVPELDEAVDLSPPTVGVGEDVEDYSALSFVKAVNLLPLYAQKKMFLTPSQNWTKKL